MSGVSIKINDQEAIAKLSDMLKRFDDLTPVLQEIGEIVRSSVERNFAAGGRPKWPQSNRVKESGGQTLSDTARLKRSFSVSVGTDSVTVGTNVVYAGVQQFGAKKGSFGTVTFAVKAHERKGRPVVAHKRTAALPWGDIPARPFLMIQHEDETEIKAALEAFFLEGLRR
ncbi:MAG: hypothetical protein FP814_09765 [Desulfobacterium sp.]|nr:hypothetical protein [Desulfobacteraceae bacterium]MBA3036767.1 hypothetical protein [Desulfobacterium sp.]